MFILQSSISFDSEALFYLEHNKYFTTFEKKLSSSTVDTNCTATEVEQQNTYSSPKHYMACIKANFQCDISINPQSPSSLRQSSTVKNVTRNNHSSSFKSVCPLENTVTEDKLSLSTVGDSTSSPLLHSLEKNISNSTGFRKDTNETQVLDTTMSSRGVHSSDIKSDCDVSLATVCFSNVKCLNPSMRCLRKANKPESDTKDISVLHSSSFASDEESDARGLSTPPLAEMEELVSTVLSLLNAEYITDTFQVRIPMSNPPSKTVYTNEEILSFANALPDEKPQLGSIEDGISSPKQVSVHQVSC